MSSGKPLDAEWKSDVETRLRKLEAWRNFVLGGGASIAAILGVFTHTILKAAGLTP